MGKKHMHKDDVEAGGQGSGFSKNCFIRESSLRSYGYALRPLVSLRLHNL
jgi:hypothetical protein